jgi:hypothetical protein
MREAIINTPSDKGESRLHIGHLGHGYLSHPIAECRTGISCSQTGDFRQILLGIQLFPSLPRLWFRVLNILGFGATKLQINTCPSKDDQITRDFASWLNLRPGAADEKTLPHNACVSFVVGGIATNTTDGYRYFIIINCPVNCIQSKDREDSTCETFHPVCVMAPNIR